MWTKMESIDQKSISLIGVQRLSASAQPQSPFFIHQSIKCRTKSWLIVQCALLVISLSIMKIDCIENIGPRFCDESWFAYLVFVLHGIGSRFGLCNNQHIWFAFLRSGFEFRLEKEEHSLLMIFNRSVGIGFLFPIRGLVMHVVCAECFHKLAPIKTRSSRYIWTDTAVMCWIITESRFSGINPCINIFTRFICCLRLSVEYINFR